MKAKMNLIFVPIFAIAIALPMNFTMAQAEVPAIAQEHVPDEVIVGYFDKGSPAENALVRTNSRKTINAVAFEKISSLATNTEVVKLANGVSVEVAIARLKNQPGIRFVEPNYIVKALDTSNDPYFTNGSLWGMFGSSTSPANAFGSNSAKAWNDGYVGSSDVVIGVIDEGMQVLHPDLSANIWVNPGDSTKDGFDNDGNGFVDDINGWDFVNNNASVYDGGKLDKHGTHVAGTIGAKGGNGFGVAGVNWNVKIISTKFLGANGGTTANAVAALDYLTNLKTRTTNPVNLIASNNSWGGGGFSQALLDAINRSGNAGMLFIAAAGNSTTNNDSTASYPSNYSCTTSTGAWDCVIAVAAIDSAGAIASFSSYGATKVDLGAPGVGIWSTLPGTYGSYSGTSMATPHVTGAAALCKSINPSITAEGVRAAILNSVAATGSLAGKTATNGRLDIGAMKSLCPKSPQTTLLISASPTAAPAPGPITLSSTPGSGDGAVTYSTSTTNCLVNGTALTTTVAPITCQVTARKAGNDTYMPAISSPIAVSFSAIAQSTLIISNSNTTPYLKGTEGVSLSTGTTGSGTGAVTYSTSDTSRCKISGNKLTVSTSYSGTISCTVTARKAASGYYLSAVSASKKFNFQ
jgi:subtilisin family serine protease